MTVGIVTGMTIHAAGYDRQSQERGNRSAASPAVQRANNKAEAERRTKTGSDVVWVGHYSEKLGTSAFRAETSRPEFERLLNDCRLGRVNMVIVDYVSRFSRLEVMDAIPIVTDLLNLGVVIVSTSEGEFRKGNLMDLIHLIMRLDAAHNESRNKSRTVKGAHDLARSLGGFVGKVPFGFECEPVAVPNPDNPRQVIVIQKLRHSSVKLRGPIKSEPDVIREAWARIERHMSEPFTGKRGEPHPGSLTGICVAFGREGVPTRGQATGKKTANSAWDPATLKRILRDPRIAGFEYEPVFRRDAEGNPTRSIDGYRVKRDPVTMRPVELDCGPIIPPADWYALQEWLDGRGRGKGQSRGQALLTAMDRLWCECSNVMVGHAKNSNPAKSAYACKRGNKIKPGQHEGSCTIAQHVLDDHVARRIFAVIMTAEGDLETGDVLAEAARRWGVLDETPERSGERAALLAERADAAQALQDLYDDRKAGVYKGPIGTRAFREAVAEATFRMEGAEERLAVLAQAETPTLPITQWLSHDGDWDGDPIGKGSWWDRSGVEDRRELVRLFIDRIEVRKALPGEQRPGRTLPAENRVTITWAQPKPGDGEEPETLAA